MTNLDDINAIKQLDTVNVLGSIELLGEQCKQAWEEVSALQFSEEYKNATAVVFSGMGGSALGAYVIKSMFFDTLSVPFEIVNDYNLPPYINNNTLVILSSYSGTTEETLSCAQEALVKKSLTTGITAGGKLGEILSKAGKVYYKINPINNPSGQPRLGTGYSVYGQIALFTKLGILNVSQTEVEQVVKILEEGNKKYGLNILTEKNLAKQLVNQLYNKIPIIVSAQFLGHIGRVMRNQIHETAKSYADYHIIPELNHHLMEGLSNPGTNKDLLKFIFVDSELYSDRIKQRMNITADVVAKQSIESFHFRPDAKTKISQAFEVIQFGAYTNYYMAMLYSLDPSKVPWVDYFKQELAKS